MCIWSILHANFQKNRRGGEGGINMGEGQGYGCLWKNGKIKVQRDKKEEVKMGQNSLKSHSFGGMNFLIKIKVHSIFKNVVPFFSIVE